MTEIATRDEQLARLRSIVGYVLDVAIGERMSFPDGTELVTFQLQDSDVELFYEVQSLTNLETGDTHIVLADGRSFLLRVSSNANSDDDVTWLRSLLHRFVEGFADGRCEEADGTVTVTRPIEERDIELLERIEALGNTGGVDTGDSFVTFDSGDRVDIVVVAV